MVLIPTLDYRAASGGWPVPLLLVLNVCSDTLQDYDCPWLKIAISSRDGLDWKKWSREEERAQDEFGAWCKHRLNGCCRKVGRRNWRGIPQKKEKNEINLKKKKTESKCYENVLCTKSITSKNTVMIIINY